MAITTTKARRSELAEVFKSHDDLFEAHFYAALNILIVYVMYEKAKGKDSFYHPYFEIMQLVDLPISWEDERLDQIYD